ncbi:MAG: substrate-binding domain-containing protein [Spirochaetales bacterium]|nr:substrate-binding domain-containing protein [Spirochaetales bacterium]
MPDKDIKRPVIALLSAYISTPIYKSRFLGIADQIHAANANLICFVTHFIQDPEGFEKQANILVDFVTPEVFDGCILGSTHKDSVKPFAELMETFQLDMPVITVHKDQDGRRFLPDDNYESMREMVRHLIHAHNRRKIAYIGGPPQHYLSQDRLRGYKDALNEEAIPYTQSLILSPINWWEHSFAHFLDDQCAVPGKDFDAVVCVSDLLALDIIRILSERGVRIPDDVAVTGFNNYLESTVISPSLSSVELNFYDKGKMAGEKMFSILSGSPFPSGYQIPSKLILRESCGCTHPDVIPVTSPIPPATPSPKKGIRQAAQIFQRRCADMGIDADIANHLAAEFMKMIDCHTGPIRFLNLFRDHLQMTSASREMLDLRQGVLNGLFNELLALLARPQEQGLAAEAFQNMRLHYTRAMLLLERSRAIDEAWTSDSIRKFGRSLLIDYDMNRMMDQVALWLSPLHLPGCYVALYTNEKRPLDGARMVLAVCDNTRLPLPPDGLVFFPSRNIVPAHLLPGQFSLIVEALYSRDRQIGYIVFQRSNRDPLIYELFAGQLANALQIALTIKEREKILHEKTIAWRKIEQSEKRFREMAENLPQAIVEFSLQYRIQYMNRYAIQLLKIKDTVKGISFLDFIEDDAIPSIKETAACLIKTGKPNLREIKLFSPENGSVTVLIKSSLIETAGKIAGIRAVLLEIEPNLHSTLQPETSFYTRYGITIREKEIMLLLIKGTSYNTIAEQLNISRKTVETHAINIYRKTRVQNRLQLLNMIQTG